MGMTIDDLKVAQADPEEISPGKFRIENVPKPHSLFDSYALQVAPIGGLSWIKAIGKAVSTSAFGSELQVAFDNLESRLAQIYGVFDRTDILLTGSIWDEPRDWMQAILAQERILMTQWSAERGSKMSDSLSSVALICSAVDTESGYIAIEYTFENEAEAETEINSLEDEAL
ncbi:hypothetical protein C2E31_19145 [Rhodopirellula baltica]|nr:hypothetical protein C2E31_19145 [Rhodopirellula baltica]